MLTDADKSYIEARIQVAWSELGTKGLTEIIGTEIALALATERAYPSQMAAIQKDLELARETIIAQRTSHQKSIERMTPNLDAISKVLEAAHTLRVAVRPLGSMATLTDACIAYDAAIDDLRRVREAGKL